jgi:hypothetical protein
VWTGYIWLRMGDQWRTGEHYNEPWFYKMQRISWLAEGLFVSQEGFWTMRQSEDSASDYETLIGKICTEQILSRITHAFRHWSDVSPKSYPASLFNQTSQYHWKCDLNLLRWLNILWLKARTSRSTLNFFAYMPPWGEYEERHFSP